MRAYSIESFGSVDGVVLGSRDDPRPGTQEILVRVRATSLNYRDLMVLKGRGCGPIKPGYLTDRLGANLDGMLAEYAVVSEEAAVAMPSHLSFEEAATLPCAAVPAWAALSATMRTPATCTPPNSEGQRWPDAKR
jgi:NADPH:quinone reductase-like Zn-dependent oxidoreductase